MDFTEEQKKLIDSENKNVQVILNFPDNEASDIHNNRIYQESMYYEESLLDQDDFKFGKCNSSCFQIKVASFNGEIDNAKMDVSLEIKNENARMVIPFGRFIVDSAEKTADRRYRNIIAYDYMKLLDIDIADWFNSVLFTKSTIKRTINEAINLLCEYIGVDCQGADQLINSDFEIENPGNVNYLLGRTFLENLCEINAVFGHFNENGILTFVTLLKTSIYPSNTLFPEKTLYPSGAKKEKVNWCSKYISCQYSDYNIKTINSVKILNQDDEIGIIATTEGIKEKDINQYSIIGNAFLYNKDTETLNKLAKQLLVAMKGLEYRPNETVVNGGLYLQLGNIVKVNARYYLEDEILDTYFESIVLKRIISGIQAIKTNISAKGNEYQSSVVDSNTQILLQKNKLAKIEKTVDGIYTEFSDFEKDTSSKFEQTSEIISSKVSKGEVSSEISQESDQITLKGNRLVVESDNFSLDQEGNVSISGNLKSKDAIILLTYGDNGFDVIEASQYAEANTLNMNGLDNENFLSYIGKYSGGDSPETLIFRKSSYFQKNLTVSGVKNRIINTSNYEKRLQYSYEMASPMFGDVGHGIIGSDGLCYIEIDSVFAETIDTEHEYYVFLQSYNENLIYVQSKEKTYFTVKGEPNSEFDWEVKAKQKDYVYERLEKYQNNDFVDYDYEKEATKYLLNYEKEIIND